MDGPPPVSGRRVKRPHSPSSSPRLDVTDVADNNFPSRDKAGGLGDGFVGVWVAFEDKNFRRRRCPVRWDWHLKGWAYRTRFRRDAQRLVDKLNDGPRCRACRCVGDCVQAGCRRRFASRRTEGYPSSGIPTPVATFVRNRPSRAHGRRSEVDCRPQRARLRIGRGASSRPSAFSTVGPPGGAVRKEVGSATWIGPEDQVCEWCKRRIDDLKRAEDSRRPTSPKGSVSMTTTVPAVDCSDPNAATPTT